MKRIGKIYEKELTLKNIYKAYYKVKKGIGNKRTIFEFNLNKNTNLFEIYNNLINKNYIFKKNKIFLISEPKYRLIMCESIKDKIVNHFIATNYLLKYLEKSFIHSNVATRKGRGSSLALNLFEHYLNKDCYILKMDITKYFYNIDHNIAISLLSKKIKDKNVLNIVKKIIDNTNQDYINENIITIKDREIRKINNLNISDKEKDKKILEINKIPLYDKGCGVPIGNMTSQILAVLYLNDVDHYIKEKLKINKYIRYMDDLVIIDNDYNNLLDYKELIEKKIN